MIDAYTIGITLALDDGVSAGVAAIAKDLAMLDRAIDTSTLRLAQLRRAGDDALGATQPPSPIRHGEMKSVPSAVVEPAPVAAPAPPAAAPEASMPAVSPGPSPAPSAPPAAMAAPRMVAPPTAPLPEPASAVLPVSVVVKAHDSTPAPAAPVIVPPGPVAGIPAAERQVAEPAVPGVHIVQPPMPRAPQPVPAVAASPVAAPPPTLAPIVVVPALPAPSPVPQPLPAAPVPSPPVSRPVPDATELVAFARSMVPEVAGPAMSRPPHSTPAQPPDAPLVGSALAAPQPPAPAAPALPTPVWHVEMTDSRRLAAAPATEHRVARVPAIAPAISPPAAPPPASPPIAHGPMGGDVFLDGARVGHWLSRHLDRMATRPPAGMTGFDPRLSPSWAGATVSN